MPEPTTAPAQGVHPPRPGLLLHTVYFPPGEGEAPADEQLRAARALGLSLYGHLCRAPGDPLQPHRGGAVRVATHDGEVRPEEAERVFLIPLLSGGDDRARRQRITERLLSLSQAPAQVEILPVWLGAAGEGEGGIVAPSAEAVDGPEVLGRILHRLERLLAPEGAPAPRLFLSHAPEGIDGGEPHALAERLRARAQQGAAGAYFAGGVVSSGPPLSQALKEGAPGGMMLVLRSDGYSAQARCEAELIDAKERRIPTLDVAVLRSGEARTHPHGANLPSATLGDGGDGGSLLVRLMVEGVLHRLAVAEGRRALAAADLPIDATLVWPRPPEPRDLPGLHRSHPGPAILLHPEPELSVHARDQLLGARPDLRLLTPSTALCRSLGATRARAPLSGWQVAFSLSAEPEAALGLTGDHGLDALSHLARALISQGAGLAYGGDQRRGGFTAHLIDLIERYNQTGGEAAELLHVYHGGPARPDAGGRPYTAHPLPLDPELGAEAPGDALGAALRLSHLRAAIEGHVQARVVLSGKTSPLGGDTRGFSGFFPGVLEEAWRALEAGIPLYILGGFGGAAGLLAQLHLSWPDLPPELREDRWADNARYRGLMERLRGDLPRPPGLPRRLSTFTERLRDLLRQRLASDEASLAWNGLSCAENLRLFEERDPLALTSLVLKGLLARRRAAAEGLLKVEMVRGSITSPGDAELLVFPTVTGAPVHGAGAALARWAPEEIERALEDPGRPIPLSSGRLDASFVMALDLGELRPVQEDVEAGVRRALARLVEVAARHTFRSVGLVSFGANLARRPEWVIPWMVDGLRALGDGVEVLWFEQEHSRALELEYRLKARGDVALSVREALPEPELPGEGAESVLDVRSTGEVLDILWLPARAHADCPRRSHPFTLEDRRALWSQEGSVTPGGLHLIRVGGLVVQHLLGDPSQEIVQEAREARWLVAHDVGSSSIPFEAMTVRDADGGIIQPALCGGVTRRLQIERSPARRPPRRGKLRALLVAPLTSDLRGAAAEVESVNRYLRASPERFTLTCLLGADATHDAVRSVLVAGGCDLLHFCGHGFFNGSGPNRGGLKLAGTDTLVAEDLQGVAEPPQVVFVNACESGRVLGLTERGDEAGALAEWFLRAGVRAFLGTLWAVDDRAAAHFAERVYRGLGQGQRLGDAVVAARRRLQSEARHDWANYLLFGDGDFRLVNRL